MIDTKAILGPEFSYTDALNHLTSEHIKKQREEGKDFQKNPLRPSAAGKCERELAYALAEYRGMAKYDKELIAPELQRIFSLGHSIEWHVLNEMKQHFKGMFEVRYQQQALSFKHLASKHKPEWSTWIEGSIDFVLWSDKFKGVGDVKSKKEKFSGHRDSDWTDTNQKYSRMQSLTKLSESAFYADNIEAFLDELNDPFIAMNVMQVNLYSQSDFLKERGIDHCFLVYYSKNTSRLREIRWRPSPELAEYVLDKFTNAFQAVEEGSVELAAKEFDLGSMKCAFCDYKKVCWSDSDPLKQWFKSFPPKRWPTDTHKLEETVSESVEELYGRFKEATEAAEAVDNIDTEICNILIEENVSKVRFSDGEVYEVKLYKSPHEHYRLKRSKA